MYHKFNTTISTFFPRIIRICFGWFSELTAIVTPYGIQGLVFLMQAFCILCEVWNKSFIYCRLIFVLKGFNTLHYPTNLLLCLWLISIFNIQTVLDFHTICTTIHHILPSINHLSHAKSGLSYISWQTCHQQTFGLSIVTILVYTPVFICAFIWTLHCI